MATGGAHDESSAKGTTTSRNSEAVRSLLHNDQLAPLSFRFRVKGAKDQGEVVAASGIQRAAAVTGRQSLLCRGVAELCLFCACCDVAAWFLFLVLEYWKSCI